MTIMTKTLRVLLWCLLVGASATPALAQSRTVTADRIRVGPSTVPPSTTVPFRLGEDNADYCDFTIADSADLTLACAGGSPTVTFSNPAYFSNTVNFDGNVTFGDQTSDTVSFTARIASNVLFSADNTYDIGGAGANRPNDILMGGDLTIGSSLFTVVGTTGNTAISGSLDAKGGIQNTTGTLSLSDVTNVTGDFSVGSTLFTVAAATGNTLVSGTFDVRGNIANNATTSSVTIGDNAIITGTLDQQGAVSNTTGDVTVSDVLAVTNNIDAQGGTITRTTAGNVNVTTTSGDLTLTPSANIILDPTSTFILPGSAYTERLGSPFAKYLSLDVAELNVDVLVSREKVATTGGWLAVTPSTSLASAMAPTDTTAVLKHNNIASGDIVHMEARGQVEFMTMGALSSTQTDTITVENATADTAATNASDTYSQTIQATNDNRVLVVGVALVGSTTVSSVCTVVSGGTSRCLSRAVAANNSTSVRSEIWYLVDPPTGTNTVTVTFGASVLHMIGGMVVPGVDQRTPIRGFNSATGNSTTPSVAVTSATGDIVLGVVASAVNTSCTIGTGETVRWNAGATGLRGAGFTEAGAASVTIAPTCGSAAWVITGVSLQPHVTSYTYNITTRDMDGTGANQWLAGDALLNYGTTNDGWLELYAERSVRSATEFGPALVVNRRSNTGYADWGVRAALGHLNGLYGQGANTYGFAAGDPSDVNVRVTDSGGFEIYEAGSTSRGQWAADGSVRIGPTNDERIAIDNTNGVRFIDNAGTVRGQFTGTDLTLGYVSTGQENINISNTAVELRENTTVYASLSASALTLGQTASEHVNVTTTSVQLKDGSTVYTDLTAGALVLGVSTTENVLVNSTSVQMRDGSTVYTDLTGGNLTLGNTTNEHVAISSTAVQIKDGATVYTDLTAGALVLGQVASENVLINGTSVQIRDATTVYTDLTGGSLRLGQTGANNENVLITTTNGIELRTDTTTYAQLSGTGLTIGSTASEHVNVSATSVQIKDGATVYTDLTGGSFRLGQTGANNENILITTTNGIELRTDTTTHAQLSGTTLTLGNVSDDNVLVDTTGFYARVAGNTGFSVKSDGLRGYTQAGSDLYFSLTTSGALFGRQTDGTPPTPFDSTSTNVLITNSWMRIREGTTDYVTLNSGGVVIGPLADEHISINTTNGLLYVNSSGQDTLNINNGSVRIGRDEDNYSRLVLDDSAGFQVISQAGGVPTTRMKIDLSGNVTIGEDATGVPRMTMDNTNGLKVISDYLGTDRTVFQIEPDGDAIFGMTADITFQLNSYGSAKINKVGSSTYHAPMQFRTRSWSSSDFDKDAWLELSAEYATTETGAYSARAAVTLGASNYSGRSYDSFILLDAEMLNYNFGTFNPEIDGAEVVNIYGTYNNANRAYTALEIDVTNTASASTSRLLKLKTGGSDMFTVSMAGAAAATAGYYERGRTTAMGEWQARTFSASNYSAVNAGGGYGCTGGTMTLTVESGDVQVDRWTKIGNTWIWDVYVANAATTGTASDCIRVLIPESVTVAHNMMLSNGSCNTSVHNNDQCTVIVEGQYVVLRTQRGAYFPLTTTLWFSFQAIFED